MKNRIIITVLLVLLFLATSVSAQTTEFTYQGKLTSGGAAANGTFEMQFRLYDAASGGTPIGAPLTNVSVAVTQGIFNVLLDFGAAAFSGADRFLEIGVRPSGSENAFTLLAPRQKITSMPYAIKSKSADEAANADALGGVPAGEFVTTSSVGNSFIKNSTEQQTADFNITGNGVVGGTLGIGAAPQDDIKLDVSGNIVFRNANGNINFGPPNGETGMTIISTNRADVRFDGSTVKLLASAGAGPPPSTNGIAVNTAGNIGIGTTAPQAKLHVAGNIVQDRDKGGMAKAMLSVNSDGTLARCYNGVSGASTGDCGFTVNRSFEGNYRVGFGFQVSDRFISITTKYESNLVTFETSNYGANFNYPLNGNNTVLQISTFLLGERRVNSDAAFMLFVF